MQQKHHSVVFFSTMNKCNENMIHWFPLYTFKKESCFHCFIWKDITFDFYDQFQGIICLCYIALREMHDKYSRGLGQTFLPKKHFLVWKNWLNDLGVKISFWRLGIANFNHLMILWSPLRETDLSVILCTPFTIQKQIHTISFSLSLQITKPKSL